MHPLGGNMVKQTGNDTFIWYVAYGSNMSSRRFKRYLDQMPDQPSMPKSIPFSLPFSVYFDRKSSTWDHQGVAFLDSSKEGFAYGRAYLLKQENFKILQQLEGWYPILVTLGNIEGIQAMTFTQSNHMHRFPPSDRYLDEIIIGLQETYPEFTWSQCNEYVLNRVKGKN
jgi:hypothetical protein